MLREENRRLREQFNALREAVLQDEAEGTFPHRTSQVLNPASGLKLGDIVSIDDDGPVYYEPGMDSFHDDAPTSEPKEGA